MSLTSPIPDGQGIAHTAIGQVCFACHINIDSDPAMFWSGGTGEMYVHPACWPALAAGMFRDYHEATRPDYYKRRRPA